jgi:hypothetical protein
VAELAPAVADQVEQVVREAFVYAFDGAMVLCTLVSVCRKCSSEQVGGPSRAAETNLLHMMYW